MKKILIIVIAGILLLGFAARLYKFDNPVADWHSWRQADTSSVSRNFVNNGVNLLFPTYQDLSNVPSGRDNPQGYRFVEFPIYNLVQAETYKYIGILTLEEWGRMVTIIISLASSFLIFLIVKRHQNQLSALIAMFFFTFLPYSIYYGRTILPDPSMIAAILASIYFFDLWLEKPKKYLLFGLSLLFTAIALLIKPFAAFFTLPMIYLALDKYGNDFYKKWQLWVFGILSLMPLIAWRVWMSAHPEGIPASGWLFNYGNIRFKGAYFYWVFGERIAKLISGYFGVSLLVLGLITKFKSNKSFWFFTSFLVSSLLYMVVVATGNVQHDYYQILIVPTLCIFMGLGGDFLINHTKDYANKYLGIFLFFVITGFTLFFGWYWIRDYYNINNPSILVAGEAVDRLTPKDAKVIANYEGDTSFLYQTKRSGWASYETGLPEMVTLGADYLVNVNPTPHDFEYAKNYKIVDQTSQYVIFDLHKSP
jgi:hypothetical protein